VLLGLVVVLALAAVAVAGCGGSSSSDATAVAAVQASLTKINAAVADMTAKGTAGTLTVADIKAARDSLKPEVQSVIDNGKKVKGADTAAVQKAWTDLDSAVTALPATATLMDAAGVLMTKITPLTSALGAIGTLVTPTT
jgi:outer membrane lipoprotein-sorting protein